MPFGPPSSGAVRFGTVVQVSGVKVDVVETAVMKRLAGNGGGGLSDVNGD